MGGIGPGLVVSVIGYYLTVPVIRAYHKRRARKMAARIARAQAQSAASAGDNPEA